jgi:hypothetical protein
VTIVGKDGRMSAFEVRSKTDKELELFTRNKTAMSQLSEGRQGDIEIVIPRGLE